MALPLTLTTSPMVLSSHPGFAIVQARTRKSTNTTSLVGALAMSETREVLSCPHCGLVQFRTQNSRCRRCHRPLDDQYEPSPCPVTVPVNSTAAAIDKRLEMAQTVGRRVRELRRMQSLSQRELAHRLNVPRTYVSKV